MPFLRYPDELETGASRNMANEPASDKIDFVPISELVGSSKSDDGTNVLLKFGESNGNEFVIGVPELVLSEIIIELIHATASFSAPKGTSVEEAPAMGTNWFQFGRDNASGDYFLRLHLVAGGHLAFVMDKAMVERLAETLNVMVLGAQMDVPEGTARN
jgi:hypothetical protein